MSLEETTARRHSAGCHSKIKFTQFLLRCAFFYLHKWLRGKTLYQHCLALSIERNASTPSLFLYTKYTLHYIHNNISVCTVSHQMHNNICVNKLKLFSHLEALIVFSFDGKHFSCHLFWCITSCSVFRFRGSPVVCGFGSQLYTLLQTLQKWTNCLCHK